jgi:GTPase SAR1 family protein
MPPQEGIHTDETNDHSLLSKTSYPHVAQTYQKTIKLLRNCGIEGLIQLPKIALIGNQSSGKSSLIEAISRVKVPRAAATCTRCPMEVILSRSDSAPWKCTVSLRFEHIDVPGTGTVGTTTIFATTDDKAKVPLILRRAQLAILNPAKPQSHFKTLDEAQCEKHPVAVKFSRNTVVMEITGAEVDVTFIDLPGIIANAEVKTLSCFLTLEPEDDHFIDLIKDLTRFYVSQEDCLVLLAITMKGTGSFHYSLT